MRSCRGQRNCTTGRRGPSTAAPSLGRSACSIAQPRRPSDPDLSARIDLTRAYAQAETGDAADAVDRCRDLLERDGLADETRGLIWAQVGLLRMRSGDGHRALDGFQEALTLLPSDHTDLGMVFINRGNVHLQRGDVPAAVADFSHARDALALAENTVEQAKAEHNLGYARLLAGDLVGAMQAIDEAGEVLAPLSPAYRATVEQDRAEVLTAAGRPREAIQALGTAANAYGSRRLRTFQAECELTLSWTMLRQDPSRARVVARRAARRFRGQASPGRALLADAAALVAEISAGGHAASLLNRVDALVADLRRSGLKNDATVVQLQGARVSVMRGDLEDAKTRLDGVRLGPSSPVTTQAALAGGACRARRGQG